MTLNLELLAKAKLSLGDLAKLIKYRTATGELVTVSRRTVYNWANGSPPSDRIAPVLIEYQELIKDVLEKGYLPVPDAFQKRKRDEYLQQLISTRIHLT